MLESGENNLSSDKHTTGKQGIELVTAHKNKNEINLMDSILCRVRNQT